MEHIIKRVLMQLPLHAVHALFDPSMKEVLRRQGQTGTSARQLLLFENGDAAIRKPPFFDRRVA